MRAAVVTIALLLSSCSDNASEITEDMRRGIHCFGKRNDYALCIDSESNMYVCFASQQANTAFCIKAQQPRLRAERTD